MDRALRQDERTRDGSREGWTRRLRARWRVLAEPEREDLEPWLRLGAVVGWRPASEILGEEPRAGLETVAEHGAEAAWRVGHALARAAVERWGRGESGRLAREVLAARELAPGAREALAEEAMALGLSERPPTAQRTGEISPSGRAAALAGLALAITYASQEELPKAYASCLQCSHGLIGPEEAITHAREALVPYLLEVLDGE